MENTAIQTPNQETGLAQFKQGVDDLLAKRDYFIQQVLPKLKENQDYYEIKGKKSLSKGGAEKLSSIFQFTATFERDDKTVEMLKSVVGMVAFVCNLADGMGNVRGQGRGADTLVRNQSDPNKTIKMAQKRAYVDAVIRTTGLSDIFTQDLEDENGHQYKTAPQPTYHPDPQNPPVKHYCIACDKKFNKQTEITEKVAEFSKREFKMKLCQPCQKLAREAKKAQNPTPAPKTPPAKPQEATEDVIDVVQAVFPEAEVIDDPNSVGARMRAGFESAIVKK